MAAEEVLAFLGAVDAELVGHAEAGEIFDLYLIGRSALILGYGLRLMTKDVDVVEPARSRLFAVAVDVLEKGGTGTVGQSFYLEAVSSGLPPMPAGFQKRCLDIPGAWRVIRPKRPEVHDLLVTKLARFHAGDREDVQILCDTGEVDVDTLQDRFDLAFTFSDPDDPRVVAATANLEVVAQYLEGRRRIL